MEIEDIEFNAIKRICIELGTKLQVRLDGVDINFKCSLIGMEPHKYLIINAPVNMLSFARYKLRRGSKVVVRYLYRGSAFGFKSELLEDIYAPLKLLFVEYPEIIEEHNLRSDQRIECVLPIKIKINGEEKQGVILDLNREGCCCQIQKNEQGNETTAVQMEEKVYLTCYLPQTEGVYEIGATVKNIRMDNKQITFGMMFNDIKPEVKDVIGQYMLAITGMSV